MGLLDSDIRVNGNIYASDINPILINFYTILKEYPEQFITCISVLTNEYRTSENREDFYYKIRDMFNSMEKSGPEHAALFFFLNRTCFRGLYREGPRGFNVPFGHYKNVDLFDANEIRNISKAIQKVTFCCEGFESSVQKAKEGDFLYLDPPYAPETSTSFVGYVSGGFVEHDDLFALLKTTCAKFVMSNADVPIVSKSFPAPFQTTKITVRRAIHSKDPSSTTIEVLITNPAIRQVS